jgi:hypothetical protein
VSASDRLRADVQTVTKTRVGRRSISITPFAGRERVVGLIDDLLVVAISNRPAGVSDDVSAIALAKAEASPVLTNVPDNFGGVGSRSLPADLRNGTLVARGLSC